MKNSRRGTRALAAVTALVVAASGAAALTQSASAYQGKSGPIRDAVLSTAAVTKAVGWPSATPLASTLSDDWDTYFERTFDITTTTDAQIAPRLVTLDVSPTAKERDRSWLVQLNNVTKVSPGTVLRSTANGITVEYETNVGGPSPFRFETVSLAKAGSDAVVSGSCLSNDTTTLTAAQRATCAERLAEAQVAAWTKVAPAFVWPSKTTLKKKLLTPKQALKASKVKKGVKLKTVWTQTSPTFMWGGRLVERKYKRIAPDALSYSAPTYVSIAHYGNRLNTVAPFDHAKSSAAQTEGPLHNVGPNTYTHGYTTMMRSGLTTVSMTVVRVGSAIVTAKCMSSAGARPSAKSVRLCSRRAANAEVARIKPIFSKIK